VGFFFCVLLPIGHGAQADLAHFDVGIGDGGVFHGMLKKVVMGYIV
jgi:hypothetical protein